MTRHGYGRGEHLDIRALWCQEVTEQDFFTTRRQRHQDTECGPNRPSHKVLQDTSNAVRRDERSNERAG